MRTVDTPPSPTRDHRSPDSRKGLKVWPRTLYSCETADAGVEPSDGGSGGSTRTAVGLADDDQGDLRCDVGGRGVCEYGERVLAGPGVRGRLDDQGRRAVRRVGHEGEVDVVRQAVGAEAEPDVLRASRHLYAEVELGG